MIIGKRLKELRELKKMSQGDIEKRTGMLRCYISRVENGHTVPSVDTLEKIAGALEIPLYRLFTDDVHVKRPNIPAQAALSQAASEKQVQEYLSFAKLFSRINEKNRGLLLFMASKMARLD
jgi:transcriptional regulator with XRE-family HTH domain